MDAPTADEIRSWSKVDFDDRDFVIVDNDPDPDTDQLDRVVVLQTAWLEDKTGLVLEDIDLSGTPDRATVRLSLSIQQAIQMLVEHYTAVASPDSSETAADINMIQNFSAGSYSENRRQYRMQYALHPWRDLDDLLLSILTDAKRAELGDEVPQVGVIPPDWDVGKEIINANRKVVGPFGPVYYPYWPYD